MAQTNYEHPKDTKVWIQAQAAYETENDIQVTTDAVLFKEFEITEGEYVVPEDDHTGYNGAAGNVVGVRDPAWRAIAHVRPSGSAGTAPDDAVLISHGIFSSTVVQPTATTILGGGATTTVLPVQVGAAANIPEHSIIGVDLVVGGYTKTYARFVTDVTGDNVTVQPALPSAPAASAAVRTSLTYGVNTAAQGTSFTAWTNGTHYAEKAGGCVMNALKIASPGALADKAPTIEVGGFCRTRRQMASTTLDGALDNSQTDLGLVNYERVGAFMPMTIEAEGANTAEAIYIDSNDDGAGQYTMTRDADGAGADAHSNGANVVPFDPGRTIAGNPIPPRKGLLEIGITSTSVQSQKWGTIEIATADGVTAYKREAGDSWATYLYGLGGLKVAGKASLIMQKQDFDWWQRYGAQLDSSDAATADITPDLLTCMATFGDVPGSMVAVYTHRTHFRCTKATAGDETVGCSLDWTARESRTSTDPRMIYIAYL